MNLSKLDSILDKKFGADWHEMEVETLSMMIGARFDDLTLLKVILLKTLQLHPATVLTDADYFMRFVEIANGNIPDPHHHDIPNSLELEFALREIGKILGDKAENTYCISNVTRYILNDEGHGEAYTPILSKYSGMALVESSKTQAADEYVSHMYGV